MRRLRRKRRHKHHLSYKAKRRIVFSLSVLVLLLLFTFRNISFFILSLSSITLLFVLYLADHLFDIRFKPRHYIFTAFIAITGLLLFELYTIYPAYDKILHFIQPIMIASIIFHMIYELDLELKWCLVFTFFIVTGFIGIFEIGEYALDLFFDLNLQGVFLKSIQQFGESIVVQAPIDDTMIDMSLGVLGTLVYVSYISLFCRKRLAHQK
jgi:hypothetical protein